MKRTIQLLPILLFVLSGFAVAQTLQSNLHITDGAVYSVQVDETNKKIYLGGSFQSVGPNTGYGVVLDRATGAIQAGWPYFDNVIQNAVGDGSGGFFIYGNFTSVAGVPRAGLVHINSDKSVDLTWDPSPNSVVTGMAISGSTVYVSGNFTSVGGQSRNRIAALDAVTGAATSWNPDADGYVTQVAVSGSTVYAVGLFTSIGGQSRNRLASIDATTGTVTSWNPNPDNTVYAIAVSGSTVYVGGGFTSIGGQARNYLAALDASTGNATGWNPNPNQAVASLAVSGDRIYVGGLFSSIAGQSRPNLAALDLSTGNLLSWNPNADSYVTVLMVSDSSVYAGGSFATIGGQPRVQIARLDTTVGNARTWNSGVNHNVQVFVASGSNVFVGGIFTSASVSVRNNIASLDAVTGAVTNWNPNANSEIRTLLLSGSTLYAGGYFTSIGGQSRNYIATLDTTTGNATSWNPNAGDYVYTMALSGSTVYAGGNFGSIGGQTRNFVAALDASTGNASAWNPNPSDYVRSVAVSGSTVYLGGAFASVGGQTRSRVAAIDATTGNATSWNPISDGTVWSIVPSGSTIYVGGEFGQVGGQARNFIAALDASTGNATNWDPNANYVVYSMRLSGSILYVGGLFSSVGGQVRSRIAAIDVPSAKATSWSPSAFGSRVLSIAHAPSLGKVYFGGDFYSVLDKVTKNIAGVSEAPTVDLLAPAAPQNLIVSDTLDQSLKIKWQENTEADLKYYYVYRGTSPSPTTRVDTAKGGAADTSKTYTGLTNGVRYYFRVTAVDTAFNESGYSNETSARPGNPNLPTVPLGLYAIASNGQVALTWLKNPDPNVQLYRILRGTTSPATTPADSTSTGNDTTRTLTGLTNGMLYYFRVVAVGITGLESAPSTEDAAVPIKAPGRVAEFTSGTGTSNLPSSDFMTASAKTIAAWIKPTGAAPTVSSVYNGQAIAGDGAGGGSYFGIKRASISSVDKIWVYNWDGSEDRVGITYTPGQWVHVALVHNGTMLYIYKNGAVADSVASGPTQVMSSQPFSIGPSYNGSIDELTVWRRVLSPAEIQSLAASTPTGLEQSLTGYWRFDEPSGAIAYDGSPAGKNISISNGIFSANNRFAPVAPVNLAVTDSSSNTLTIKWNKNTDADFLRYLIYRGTSPGPTTRVDSTTGGIADTSKTFTGLTNGTRYYFRVTAVDSAGNESAYSNEVDAVPADRNAPSAPLSLVVTDSSSKTITVKWRKNNEADFLRYRIYRATSPGPTTKVDSSTAGVSDTSKTFTGLTNGTRHYFRVTAVDSAGNESGYSNEVNAVPADRVAPTAPQNLVVTDSTSTKIGIKWRKNTDADFLRYRIYRGTSPSPTTKVDSTSGGNTDTSKTFTSLTNGTRYYLRVTAVDSAGNESGYSNEVNGAPNAASAVEDGLSQIPREFSLSQNYPNPFNPSTVIRYGLPTRSHVKLEVYNMLGQRVALLADEEQDAHFYEKTWQTSISSGLYFYRLAAVSVEDPNKSFVQVRKMLLLK